VAQADLTLSAFGREAKSIFTFRLHWGTSAVHVPMQTSAPQKHAEERARSFSSRRLAAVNPMPDHLTG
jgi:hypothetical protein